MQEIFQALLPEIPTRTPNPHFVFLMPGFCFFSLAPNCYPPYNPCSYLIWLIWLIIPLWLKCKSIRISVCLVHCSYHQQCLTTPIIVEWKMVIANILKLQVFILTLHLTEEKKYCSRIKDLLNIRSWSLKDLSSI